MGCMSSSGYFSFFLVRCSGRMEKRAKGWGRIVATRLENILSLCCIDCGELFNEASVSFFLSWFHNGGSPHGFPLRDVSQREWRRCRMQRLRNNARSFLKIFLDLLENITAGRRA